MELRPREIYEYRTSEGKIPFKNWFLSLQDERAVARIFTRLQRMALGHFGDCRFVGKGVLELRIHFGPGYRVYFGEDKGALIILLCGGDKSSQSSDIQKAHIYWEDYLKRQ